MSRVIKITDGNYEHEIAASPEPVLLDFGATWCGPCKQLAPIVEQIADEYAGRLKVGAIDIEESPDTAVRFGVMGVPTLVLLQNGQVKARHTGIMQRPKLSDWISRAL